jgi:hypothetical protein
VGAVGKAREDRVGLGRGVALEQRAEHALLGGRDAWVVPGLGHRVLGWAGKASRIISDSEDPAGGSIAGMEH